MSVERFRCEVSKDPRQLLTSTHLLFPISLTSLIRYAPFVYDAWKHPETLAIISKIAGIELVTEMDFEIGHVNISVKSEKQKAEELDAFMDRKLTEDDEGIAGCPWEDDKPIVDWHTDSYPFVCVTMLSDCTNMIGGETALRTGDGDIVKIRGPQMVCGFELELGQAYDSIGLCYCTARPLH